MSQLLSLFGGTAAQATGLGGLGGAVSSLLGQGTVGPNSVGATTDAPPDSIFNTGTSPLDFAGGGDPTGSLGATWSQTYGDPNVGDPTQQQAPTNATGAPQGTSTTPQQTPQAGNYQPAPNQPSLPADPSSWSIGGIPGSTQGQPLGPSGFVQTGKQTEPWASDPRAAGSWMSGANAQLPQGQGFPQQRLTVTGDVKKQNLPQATSQGFPGYQGDPLANQPDQPDQETKPAQTATTDPNAPVAPQPSPRSPRPASGPLSLAPPRSQPPILPPQLANTPLGQLAQAAFNAISQMPGGLPGIIQSILGGGPMGSMGGQNLPPWMPGYGPGQPYGMQLRPQDRQAVQLWLQQRQQGGQPSINPVTGRPYNPARVGDRAPGQPGIDRPYTSSEEERWKERSSAPGTPSPGAQKVLGGTPMPKTNISSQGNSMILQEEGWAPRAKWDYRQWTNGYGTKAAGPGEVISREEAGRRFTDEVNRASDAVNNVVPDDAPQNVRDALTSFTFNVGTAWTRGGRLATAVSNGDWNRAANIMAGYVHAGGQVVPDLVGRRQREIRLMMQTPTQPPSVQPAEQPSQPVVSDPIPNMAA